LPASVFPNPVRDGRVNLVTETRKEGAITWRMTDVAGLTVQTGTTQAFEAGVVQTTINPSVKAGVYFLQLTAADGRQHVSRLVVE
jgi:hypothetical protein